MIINSDHWPNIVTFGNYDNNNPFNRIEWVGLGKGPDLAFYVKNYDDTNYWYVMILNGDAFYHYPINTLMSHYLLKKVKNKELVIVVSNYSEAYHDTIDGIYKHLIIANEIPVEQVLYLTNSPDIATEINHISAKYNLPPIRAEWLLLYEWDATVYANSKPHEIPDTAIETLNRSVYQKKFLSFNGQPRTHRVILMGLLCAYDLIDLGHVSYNCYVYGTSIDELPSATAFYNNNMLALTQNNPEILQLLTDNKEKICNLKPMFLDTTAEDQRSRARLRDSKKEYYEDTYFSVVTETLCMEMESNAGETGAGRILSEKIFKAIVNRHPFIILGRPKSLQLLKELGYKTFRPWINEDYDNELDDITRIYMVVKEIKKLAELSDDRLAKFLIFAKEIVEHNFNNVKSKWSPKSIPLNYTPKSPNYSVFHQHQNEFNIGPRSDKTHSDSTFANYSIYTMGNIYTVLDNLHIGVTYHLRTDRTSVLLISHDFSTASVTIFAELIENIIKQIRLKPEQLYLVIMDPLQVSSIEKLLFNKGIKIHITARNHLLIDATPVYTREPMDIENLFSVFTRASRPWRFYFYCDLLKNNLLDRCIYSYININPYGDANDMLIEHSHIKTLILPEHSSIQDKIERWVDGMPYCLVEDKDDYSSTLLSDTISKTLVHIILETEFDDEEIHVTEKTWRAISVRKPFIIYGNTGCLDWLHKHGYKTFHPFINEEYDAMDDNILRKDMILAEMNRISKMSSEELMHLINGCKESIEHNHRLFLEEKNYQWSSDFSKLGIFK
jgi:hypothetical protein